MGQRLQHKSNRYISAREGTPFVTFFLFKSHFFTVWSNLVTFLHFLQSTFSHFLIFFIEYIERSNAKMPNKKKI